MLMEHILKHVLATYKDGFQNIEYCSKCGAEGVELLSPCEPLEACKICGHHVCQCLVMKLNFKKAIDKQNNRN